MMEEGQPLLHLMLRLTCLSAGVKIEGDADVGGLVGQGARAAIISSYVTGGTVESRSDTNNIAGLVGNGIDAVTITTSYVQRCVC